MAYELVYDDNYIEFLRGRDDVARCPACSVPTHPYDHGFPQKKIPRNKDISCCFEGFALVSPRLRILLDGQCTSPVEYFETGGGYFILRPVWSVFLDFTVDDPRPEEPWRRPPCGEEFCGTCGRHNAYYGFFCGILPGQREIGDFDMARSAQERGHKMRKSFTLIVGKGLADAMKAAKIRGGALIPVEVGDFAGKPKRK